MTTGNLSAKTSATAARSSDFGPAAAVGTSTGHAPTRTPARLARNRRFRRRITRARFLVRASRDSQLLLALGLALPAASIELAAGDPAILVVLAIAGVFLSIQFALTAVGAREGLAAPRLALSLAFVLAVNLHEHMRTIGPLSALVVPVVALAAANGTRGGVIVAIAGFLATLAPTVMPDIPDPIRQQAVAMATAEIVLGIGIRRVVSSLERSALRARDLRARDRRRALQFGAVEEVGRILAREGPSADILAKVMEILEATFGYRYPSVYLWDGTRLRLGAQRNYANPIEFHEPTRGVFGRVARTHQPAFVPDVSVDPDYVSADPEVKSGITVPLLSGGDLLGILSVESSSEPRLDLEDFATMQIVGDRLAAALALGRERQKLNARGDLLVRLTSFSASLNATLDPATAHDVVAVGASQVVPADMIVVTVLDRTTSEYRVAAIAGGDPRILGIRILPGEGVTGRAIEERRTVIDDRADRSRWPKASRSARIPDVVAAMAVPLLRNDEVIGTITWLRDDLSSPYSPEEQEVAALLGVQVALALMNGGLLHEAQQAAVIDALTGLHNRRYFDTSFDRLLVGRLREAEDERHPLSAVMFDLDHFGQVNKLHGHQVGDRVLRAFADVLRARVRAGDLLARFGGEEFVVILEGATRDQAARVAEEVRASFEEVRVQTLQGEPVGCTVSAGCSALAPSQTSGSTLLEMADVALAMAKGGGRNQVVVA